MLEKWQKRSSPPASAQSAAGPSASGRGGPPGIGHQMAADEGAARPDWPGAGGG
eukprot:CAMPEP_0185427104 /NCGR_PEP_ID=MMETSP1365-20130426/15185_1 /TAXON_ID=38817 /ORGANISM="Gephyrocapsa oceanica, Strain RCC1303" /LENGTH=53 /DNA_ID=CAMNT_0028031205 /DNA_START=1 /DNA_END=158 /DNA_ORIENTATION=-